MKQYFLAVLLGFLALGCSKKDDPVVVEKGAVFINEILASGDDWLELYNSSDQPVNVGGYSLYDNPEEKYSLPAGTTIPAKGFILLYCNGEGTGLNTSFKLAAEGETVYLETNTGTVTDMLTFPALGANQSYGRYPDGTEAFATSGTPSPGSSNGNTQSPVITAVNRLPLVPRPADAVVVSVVLEKVLPTTSVTLYHKKNNGNYEALPMTAKSGGVYEATIPQLGAAGMVSYYVEASHGGNLNAHYPATAPQSALQYIITTDELPQLYINEFMAANQACCTDPSGQEEYDDWIEIYNAGNQPMNLAGMYISDNAENPFKYQFPEGQAEMTTIAAGGYLVVWADEQGVQGPLHASFKLAADGGENIGIYYLDGRTIDEISFGPQTIDVSRGRLPNGGDTWVQFTSPTLGTANK